MTLSEAVPLLAEQIKRMSGLRHRPAYNAEYRLWEKETVRVLAEGFDLSYLMRFERFKPHNFSALVKSYESYLKDLDKKKRLIEEVLNAHRPLAAAEANKAAEQAAAEPEPAVTMRPEELSELGIQPEDIEIKLQPAEPALGYGYQEAQAPARREKPAPAPVAQKAQAAQAPAQPETPAAAPAAQEAQAPVQPEKPAPAPAAQETQDTQEAQASAQPDEPTAEPAAAAVPEEPLSMLPIEERLRNSISDKERLLAETQKALADDRRQLEAVGRLKGLLTAEGDALRALTKEALGQLGLEVAANGDERSLFLKQNGDLVPLEMEAAGGPVPERALRRLISRLPDEPPKGCAARGLLLASANMKTPLKERLDAAAPAFEDRLQDQARSFAICLVSLQDVFQVLMGECEVAPSDVRERLLNTTGPFSTT